MSDNPVMRVGAASSVGDAAEANLPKGSLTGFDDGSYVGVGNGSITPTTFSKHMIAADAKKDGELQQFADSPDAWAFVAQQNMTTRNRHMGIGIDDAVPPGDKIFLQGGPTLKQMLAPFKDRLPELRNMLENMGDLGMGGATGRTIGRAPTPGIGIPLVEPE